MCAYVEVSRIQPTDFLRIELGTLRCLSKFKIAMGHPIKPNELLYIYIIHDICIYIYIIIYTYYMLELRMTGNGMLIPKISDQKSLGTSQKNHLVIA